MIIRATSLIGSRRHRLLDYMANGNVLRRGIQPGRVLEVGYANGKGFVTLVAGRDNLQIYGIDLVDKGLRRGDFTMIVGDASHLSFPDDCFDVVLSFGVLKHVQPVEKLRCMVWATNRVGKSSYNFMPTVSVSIEPHTS